MTALIILMTRPIPASNTFIADLGGLDPNVRVVVSPAFEIMPLDFPPIDDATSGFIVTSVNGVAALVRIGASKGLPVWCVGPQTDLAARQAGHETILGGGDANGLVRRILQSPPKGRLCHLRGEHGTGDIADRLTAAGVPCNERNVYAQNALPPTPDAVAAFMGNTPLLVPLFSPRSAAITLSGPAHAPVHVVAISQAVADIATDLGADTVLVAPSPDGPAMISATKARLSSLELPAD